MTDIQHERKVGICVSHCLTKKVTMLLNATTNNISRSSYTPPTTFSNHTYAKYPGQNNMKKVNSKVPPPPAFETFMNIHKFQSEIRVVNTPVQEYMAHIWIGYDLCQCLSPLSICQVFLGHLVPLVPIKQSVTCSHCDAPSLFSPACI